MTKTGMCPDKVLWCIKSEVISIKETVLLKNSEGSPKDVTRH